MANEKPVKHEGADGAPKAIITQDNKDPHRLKKMVTFMHEEAKGPAEETKLAQVDESETSLTDTD